MGSPPLAQKGDSRKSGRAFLFKASAAAGITEFGSQIGQNFCTMASDWFNIAATSAQS
jgi:hypothetical protein